MADLTTIPATDLKVGMFLSILGRSREICDISMDVFHVKVEYLGERGRKHTVRYETVDEVEVVAAPDGF